MYNYPRFGTIPGGRLAHKLHFSTRARQNLEGWAHELSRTGIGLDLAEPLEVDSAAVVRIHARQPCGTLLLAMRIKHATAQVNGTWRVGCAFEEPLDLDMMDALL